MHQKAYLQIPKKLKQVTLWVHSGEKEVGLLFLNLQSKNRTGEEDPAEVVNQDESFIVLKCEQPDESRFYNLASIIRLEYSEENASRDESIQPMHCRVCTTDGAIIEGSLRKALPPYNSRLYDCLNADDERFIKLYVDDDNVCLVNKSYIVCVTPLTDDRRGDPEVPLAGLDRVQNTF